MSENKNELKELCIKELITKEKYIIPIYQRNYAWGVPEIKQLIRDIADYVTKDQKYYIGTLIVDQNSNIDKNYYEVIDGQQRFTSLHLLCSYLKNVKSISISDYQKINIDFFSRPNSKIALESVFKNEIEQTAEDNNQAIFNGNEIIKNSFDNILKEVNIETKDFSEYLLNNVVILRVQVPEDTDLNHYFEVMNNRGEQLEKHEIIKSRMMSILNENITVENGKVKAISTFQSIWEACSNMNSYVQYGFKTDSKDENNDFRKKIFGEYWDRFKLACFDELTGVLNPTEEKTCKEILKLIKLSEIISNETISTDKSKDVSGEESQRFESVINFQNFLLQALRIIVNVKYKEKIQEDDHNISLDDKQLINEFDKILKQIPENNAKVQFVKDFGFYLLKIRFLFDKYIIKREFKGGSEDWSLQQLKKRENENQGTYSNSFIEQDKNTDLLMLLSMFHVTSPTQNYKHWLTGALKYIFENEIINTEKYRIYLEEFAKAFLFERFLAVNPKDYYDIIFNNFDKYNHHYIDKEKLNKGTQVENFIFNYLDYLLWKEEKSKYSKFKFSFRSSVEHHYPQNPPSGKPKLKQEEVDNFGNLSLMSRERNSKFTNNMPESKSSNFTVDEVYDSIKMRIMFEKSKVNWGLDEIKEHGEKMIELLIGTNAKSSNSHDTAQNN